MAKNQKKISKNKLIIVLSILFVLGMGVVVGVYKFLKSNNLPVEKEYYLYIQPGATYNDVLDSLMVNKCIEDPSFFNWLANRKGYPSRVKSGRYKIVPHMNINTLLNKLKSGNQDPLSVVVGNFRTKEALAKRLSKKLMFDSADFMNAFENKEMLDSMGFTNETAMAIFIPNTYEFYWDITPENFLRRMYKEYDAFWNGIRDQKAKSMKMTRLEIITLASIVEEETNKNDEKPLIASVYLNRLRQGRLLQADPTVRYAIYDFSIRRILRKHLSYDSPYNTYMYKGLPPGPICIPSIASIDAVLENRKTYYLFFCAKEDFSGYHNFAVTHAEHVRNARNFQKALNERKIYK